MSYLANTLTCRVFFSLLSKWHFSQCDKQYIVYTVSQWHIGYRNQYCELYWISAVEYPAHPVSRLSVQLLSCCTLFPLWLQEEVLWWVGCFQHVWNGFGGVFITFFIVLQIVKYKSSSPGLFVSFCNTEDLTCKLRFDSLYVDMVCPKLKQTCQKCLFYQALWFSCAHLSAIFYVVLKNFGSRIVFSILMNMWLKIFKESFLMEVSMLIISIYCDFSCKNAI